LAATALALALAVPAFAAPIETRDALGRIALPVPVLGDGTPAVPGVCINLFQGGDGADDLGGSNFGDVIMGSGGDDQLAGLGGDDCLLGDSGSDRLYGSDGTDDLRGMSGRDLLDAGSGNDNLDGGGDRDRLVAGSGNDKLMAGGAADSYSAGSGRDQIDAMDGYSEWVDCGGDTDRVLADRNDRLTDCERVKRR
jgi:Ca2+-binding RTX toxin-like protein